MFFRVDCRGLNGKMKEKDKHKRTREYLDLFEVVQWPWEPRGCRSRDGCKQSSSLNRGITRAGVRAPRLKPIPNSESRTATSCTVTFGYYLYMTNQRLRDKPVPRADKPVP